MSIFESTWRLKFDPNPINKGVKSVTENLDKAVKKGNALGDCFKRISAIDIQTIGAAVQTIKGHFQDFTTVGKENETALAEVSAITGVVGADLQKLNDRAKDLSTTYGEGLNENLGSFQTILSRLGPDIGKNDKAMGVLGESVNVLSKGMKGDIEGATDAITTSMLQFQVDLKNPVKAAEESRRMINVMAAGAKEGAAEIPQIGEALVNAGVSAKLANLTFEETNSAIQAMASGGKYGSEAGVAIRNVITNMSASTALSKDAVKILDAYGISTKKMSDTSVPWAERLKQLAPIQNDINALTEIFGRENSASAQILIRSADAQAELTKNITGTNVAYEQAAVIMDTTAEKDKRRLQHFEMIKLAIGNVTKQYQPYIDAASNSITAINDAKNAYDGVVEALKTVRNVLHLDTLAKWINKKFTNQLSTANLRLALTSRAVGFSMAWTSLSTLGLSGAMLTLKASINSVSVAIMQIPVVGWIIALIAVLATAFVWLWNNVGEFRGFFYGIWEVIKVVFGGIWNVTKLIFKGIWEVIKIVFSGIWTVIKTIIGFIVGAFMWYWNVVKTVFAFVVKIIGDAWNWVAVKFQWAWNIIKIKASGIWNTLKNVFSNVKAFFKETFGGVWDVVAGVFDRIWKKIEAFLKFLEPLKKALGGFWDSIKGAFNKGMQKGVKEVSNEKRQDAIDKGLANGSLVEYNGKVITKKRYDDIMKKEQTSMFGLDADTSGGANSPTKTIDYDKLFAKKEKKKKEGKESGTDDGLNMSGAKGNRTINQTITFNNYFSAAKNQVGNVANELAGKINDKLRDGMVALD